MDSDGEDKPQDLKRLMILAKKTKVGLSLPIEKKGKKLF